MKRAFHSAAIAIVMASLSIPVSAQDAASSTPSPAEIIKAAPPGDWKPVSPDDLMVMELAPDDMGKPRRVIIRLMPQPLSQPWVDNIRKLARAHWWDAKSVYRVVDNFVAQWGGGDNEEAGFPPYVLPDGIAAPQSGYAAERSRDSRTFWHREWRDPHAPHTGFRDGFPVAWNADEMWPVHCYGAVAVARDLPPDTGSGAELYAVIGNAPRSLDRNLAVVGRVIAGMEHLATLPRGTGPSGVYMKREEDTPIRSVRLASELADPPQFEFLDTASETFARYVTARSARSDAFFVVPPGPDNVCALPVPTRPVEQ